MKNLFLFVAAVALIGYFGYQQFMGNKLEPLYEEPYVILYGNPSCGWCQKMENDLKAQDIPYFYENMKEQTVLDEVLPRMEAAGLNTMRYNYPIMDVNGRLFMRPDVKDVVAAYNK
jgi:thiol-disulfide isomerase/thioredoxin